MLSSNPIKRINEDFYLHFAGGEQLSISDNFSFISDSSDWSVSWFDLVDESATGKHTVFTTYGGSGSGLDVNIDLTGANYVLETVRYTGGTPFTNNPIVRAKNTTTNINHFVLSYNSATFILSVYLNGHKLSDEAFVGVAFGSSGTNTYIGSNHNNTANQRTGGLLKLAFFNSQLTQQEVTYLYENAEIPESKFSNLQDYYPLNQIAYKDTNNYFSDVVKVYNPTATSYRAEALGYTDDELGTGANGLQSDHSYYDYKTKERRLFTGIDLNGNTGSKYIDLTTNLSGVAIPSSFSFKWIVSQNDVHLSAVRKEVVSSQIPPISSSGDDLFLIRRDGDSIVVGGAPNGGSQWGNFLSGNKSNKTGKHYTHVITYDGSTFSLCINGELVDQQTANGSFPLTFGNSWLLSNITSSSFSPFTDKIFKVAMINKALNATDALKWSTERVSDKQSNVVNNDYLFSYEMNYTNGGTSLNDLSTNSYDGAFVNIIEEVKPEKAPELYSNLPLRKKGLQFNGTNQYLETASFTEGNTSKGYTILLGVQDVNITSGQKDFFVMDDTTANNRIRIGYDFATSSFTFNSGGSGSPTEIQLTGDKGTINLLSYRIAGTGGYYYDGQKDRVADVTLQARQNDGAYGFANRVGSQSIFIGKDDSTNYTDMVLVCGLIIEGQITDRELKYLVNSGLLNNPSNVLKDKYTVLWNIDINNPFNDTGTLKFPDLSDNSYSIVANNYTDLATLQSNLVDLTSLF